MPTYAEFGGWAISTEVLQLFDFAEKPLAFALSQKSRSLIVRHLGKAVFEQNRDFSEESNLCNTSTLRILEATNGLEGDNLSYNTLPYVFAPRRTLGHFWSGFQGRRPLELRKMG